MMADPLSITAGVIATATATIQLAKSLFEIIDDIKDGPGEIVSVSKDAHAFCSIIFALLATLKENKVRHVVERDKDMVEMIRNLDRPLSHCQALLGELVHGSRFEDDIYFTFYIGGSNFYIILLLGNRSSGARFGYTEQSSWYRYRNSSSGVPTLKEVG